ncbi:HPr kinase/phosphorylase [Mesorhizobium sp. LHD-90]|uniref:HPr kinase/phosphorylase n=1 Tax=Mesorhizobium sp. LHD-90 TaxID=3071414 RepID=UPI0027E1297A|nr:HPr kinase/phosphorylase [Mesorhizobium sp. LHD-90]MDQ6434202.1 HPr kinase/phosphorylase [Mesorhizobium sp. LHD-90]
MTGPTSKPPPNLHATVIVIGDRGILIRGASGSGKTTLALALLAAGRAAGRNAALLADDQVLLTARGDRLVCLAPRTIAGLVEVRGLTPLPIAHEGAAVVDLVVTLVEAGDAPRYDEGRRAEIAGCELPELLLAAHNLPAALPAVLARLSLPPFG